VLSCQCMLHKHMVFFLKLWYYFHDVMTIMFDIYLISLNQCLVAKLSTYVNFMLDLIQVLLNCL